MLHNSLHIVLLMCLLNNSSLWRLVVCLGTFYNLKWLGNASRWMSCVKNVNVLSCVYWNICLLCVIVLTFVWTKYDNVLFVNDICKKNLLITLIKNVTTTSKRRSMLEGTTLQNFKKDCWWNYLSSLLLVT
jgi:hypothetical protein